MKTISQRFDGITVVPRFYGKKASTSKFLSPVFSIAYHETGQKIKYNFLHGNPQQNQKLFLLLIELLLNFKF